MQFIRLLCLYFQKLDRNPEFGAFCVVTWLSDGRSGIRFSAEARDSAALHNIQTGDGAFQRRNKAAEE
jgi:hypothetical protein